MKALADNVVAYDLNSGSSSPAGLTPPVCSVELSWELPCPHDLAPAHPAAIGSRAVARRLIELAIVCAALLFMLPVLGTIFALLKLQDGGPALFGHWRIGRGGRRFRCWKFRTMVMDADQRLRAHLENDPIARLEWEADQKLRTDPRVTPLGRFLRKSSLDELPQLLNVLNGEMSLIGPRPIVVDEIQKYGRRYRDYVCVRPGITGLWQVSGRNGTTYRRRVAIDTFYVRHWNLRLDAAILLRTIKVVLTSDGAF